MTMTLKGSICLVLHMQFISNLSLLLMSCISALTSSTVPVVSCWCFNPSVFLFSSLLSYLIVVFCYCLLLLHQFTSHFLLYISVVFFGCSSLSAIHGSHHLVAPVSLSVHHLHSQLLTSPLTLSWIDLTQALILSLQFVTQKSR